jgi:hypothetical protein
MDKIKNTEYQKISDQFKNLYVERTWNKRKKEEILGI